MLRFTPFRFLMRGLGGPAAAILASGLLTFPIIVDEIRRGLGSANKDADSFVFADEFDFYKISAMLVSINKDPLNNLLYNKMSKMIFERKIKVNVDLIENAVKKSDPYKIVIGEYTVKRGFDE